MNRFAHFESELEKRAKVVRNYILKKTEEAGFMPEDIKEAMCHYFLSSGKMLRPGVLLFSCSAVGGDEQLAWPAAAAIEVFHTWTLVHDDIIDRDNKRRGKDTVHHKYFKKSLNNKEFGFAQEQAKHYGVCVGILVGDAQHGWSISLLTELSRESKIDPSVTLFLIRELDSFVLNTLVAGEMLDIIYSRNSFESLNESSIIDMLWRKTGALYEFAGKAGAMIGLNIPEPNHPYVKAISSFTSKCGTAFQLQDDILGIVGDEKKLGKSIGSDIREGKKTIIVYHALKNASESQRQRLRSILGSESATQTDIEEIVELLKKLGGIEKAERMAEAYIRDAQKTIDVIPESDYKNLLSTWADFLISRDF